MNVQRGSTNEEWSFDVNENGSTSYDAAQLAVLMDIRAELKRLNAILYCSNFLAIPNVLRDIRQNTKRRKRKQMPKLRAVG